ncbi:MAG: hypothetical protein QOF58_3441 [Pseudonocardiales bacterium]|nr:hypothetical protein [Pseudonocardiales bacterium]
MKKLTVATAAALALGMLVAPAAQADPGPVYDPGSVKGSDFTMFTDWGGIGDAKAVGKFVEYTVSLGDGTYVRDLADDGLDVHLWVLYGKTLDYSRTEDIGTVSGRNVVKAVRWTSPAELHVDYLRLRLCFGPGEEKCSGWEG